MDNYFDLLPQEMRTEIFLHLDYYTILRFRVEYPVLSTNSFWTKKLDNDFGKFDLRSTFSKSILEYKNQIYELFGVHIQDYRSYWRLQNNPELIWYIRQINNFDGLYIGFFKNKDEPVLATEKHREWRPYEYLEYCDYMSLPQVYSLYFRITGDYIRTSKRDACNILIQELFNRGAIIKEFD